ncbi:MAG: TIGR02217 family protein [Holosporales bacterium]|jgi:uncharacterized protein (TIGR02217 family)
MSFHPVLFPVDISYGSAGGPQFSTDVVETISGFEQRNVNWSQARLRYNVAYGVRSAAQLETLLAFFRARQGKAYGFRFRDWTDYQSCPAAASPAPLDQNLGSGDGTNKMFALRKAYTSGATTVYRPITKPVAGSIRVALNGVEQLSGWTIDTETGLVTFTAAPASGVSVTAGFLFDVPVRFDSDTLSLSLDSYGVGSANGVDLIEVR